MHGVIRVMMGIINREAYNILLPEAVSHWQTPLCSPQSAVKGNMETLKKECILSDVYQLQKQRVIIVASVLVLIIFVQTSFMIWMGMQCAFDENTSVSATEVSFVRVCLAHIYFKNWKHFVFT